VNNAVIENAMVSDVRPHAALTRDAERRTPYVERCLPFVYRRDDVCRGRWRWESPPHTFERRSALRRRRGGRARYRLRLSFVTAHSEVVERDQTDKWSLAATTAPGSGRGDDPRAEAATVPALCGRWRGALRDGGM